MMVLPARRWAWSLVGILWCLVLALSLAAELPAELNALLDAKKYDEACLRVYALAPDAVGAQRIELLRVAFDRDPDLTRLKAKLRAILEKSPDAASQSGVLRLLAQLAMTQRDFASAQWAYGQMPDDVEASLQSAGLLLLLGRHDEAKSGLVAILTRTKDAAIIERTSCLLAWLVWSDGQGRSGLEILANKKSPQALYLTAVIARSLGLKKEDQAARDRLNKDWPRSVWTNLAMPDSDPAVQVDTTMLVLSGIGVAAAGDSQASAAQAAAGARSAGGDDSPARAIQVGLFKDPKNARKLADSLNAKGFMGQVEEDKGAGGKLYKVVVLIRPGQDPQTLIIQLKDIGQDGVLVF